MVQTCLILSKVLFAESLDTYLMLSKMGCLTMEEIFMFLNKQAFLAAGLELTKLLTSFLRAFLVFQRDLYYEVSFFNNLANSMTIRLLVI